MKEDKRAIRIQFLEKKADGYFQLKKRDEETEKDIVFMRNVDVEWKGIGRYEVLREKEIRKKHEEFRKTLRLKKKVVIHPIFLANHFIYLFSQGVWYIRPRHTKQRKSMVGLTKIFYFKLFYFEMVTR